MGRPDPISWHPETMTKAEHRDEALRLMGQARRPHALSGKPFGHEAVMQMFTAAQLHLALSTDPLTPDERTEPAPRAHTNTDAAYRQGWRNHQRMRALHDRLDGFAIVDPLDTDPFEFNKEALAQYGITTHRAMYAVADAPHGTNAAHPPKLLPRDIPASDKRSYEGRHGLGLT